MTIRHPYTFVRFPEKLAREKWSAAGPCGHERFLPGSFSGAFDCVLTTATPLCIKEHFRQIHWRMRPPFLPGSSLKGMLRNTMQILGYGCASQQFQNKKAVKQEAEGRLPPLQLGHMAPCTKDEACMACRVFGYGVKTEEGRGEKEAEPFGWAAKIHVFDSEPARDWSDRAWSGMNDSACTVAGHPPAMPQDQGPRHRAFYYPFGDGRPAGWKIYRHARRVARIDDGYASADCVQPGTKFPFRVEFENLTPAEYAAFEFALALTHKCPVHDGPAPGSLMHKLGYGKGVGMGSCRVEVAKRESIAVRRFFDKPAEALGDQPCGLSALIDSDVFKEFRTARATSGAADLLVFPTWGEFKSAARKSIDDFDKDWARQNPQVNCAQRENAGPVPVQREVLPLPATLRGVVTSIKSNIIKGETVEEYNGAKYRFEVPAHAGLGLPVKAAEIVITVDSGGVNHETRKFRGKRWQS